MKWIKRIVIVVLSILASALFAYHSQRVSLDSGAMFTIDPSGSLYLLSEEGALRKVSSQGRLLWEIQLPQENEDGNLLRYGDLISDGSGSLYLAVQEYERQVDAAGAVQEVILTEEIQTWSGDGVQQDSVLSVDKTTLSQYSTEPYIRKLQMQGEVLLALCCDQGRFDVIQAQPYSTQAPSVAASYDLAEAEEDLEDVAALSDGTLLYSTVGGSLYALSPGGEMRDLSQLVGLDCMVGQLSADETDLVYFMDRSSGVLYELNLAAYTVERLFSPETVLDGESSLTFGQLQGARAAGSGAFCAVSIDSAAPLWVRFGADAATVVSEVHRGWSGAEIGKTALAFLGALILLSLLAWVLGRLLRRSRLTGRIILQFLPALVVVLALLAGGAARLYVDRSEQAQEDSLRAAALAAVDRLDGTTLTLAALRSRTTAQRAALSEQMADAADYAAGVSGIEDVGLLLYTLEDTACYGVIATRERDAFSTAAYLAPLTLEVPAETAAAVLACAAEGGSVSLCRSGVDYVSYIAPITNAAGSTVGLMEARVERQSALAGLDRSPAFYACAIGAAAAAMLLLWLLAVLIGAFRPLKELSRCIAEISAGNWSVQAKITSRDELADIGVSFNQMTEKLNQYISNMVLLNNEYIKFTPRELFQLLGKTKVTDLSLRDKSVRDMSLLYVTFSVGGEKLDSEAYFSLMNDNFDRIFDVVDINHGIIERFDGAGMLALFPYQVRDALNTAISLKEIMAREDRSVELKMLISADETLVGVAGNQKRQTITAISDTIMDIYALGSLMDEIGTRYIITRQAVERIGDSFYFNCREIGSGDSGRESLYEFLDGMDTYEKKLHLVTREEFEQGVHDYQRGRYAAARKHFASVLQVNERDAVAMHYLMLCDTHAQTEAVLFQ